MSDRSTPEVAVESQAIDTTISFIQFFALHYRKTRMPMFVAASIGVLVAVALSWLKPQLGYFGMIGIVLGALIIAVSSFVVYAIQLWYTYYAAHTKSIRSIHYTSRSASALILSTSVIALIPLVAMCAAEYFGPDYGIVRSVAIACGFGVSTEVSQPSASGGTSTWSHSSSEGTSTLREIDEEFRVAASQKGQKELAQAKILVDFRNDDKRPWEDLGDTVEYNFVEVKDEFDEWKRGRIAAGDRYK